MTALIVILAIVSYLVVGAGVAWLLGKTDPYSPAWGALVWPIILPLSIIVNIYEICNRRGRKRKSV